MFSNNDIVYHRKYYSKDDECEEKPRNKVFKSPETKNKTSKIYIIISQHQ